jgi:hypothetical protein
MMYPWKVSLKLLQMYPILVLLAPPAACFREQPTNPDSAISAAIHTHTVFFIPISLEKVVFVFYRARIQTLYGENVYK